MADNVTSRSTLGAIAKTTIDNIAEESKRVLGKGGGIAAAALASIAVLGPLGIFGTDEDEYKQQLSGHWQHTLLGADLEMNKIPSRDDLYNTVRGLPHTGLAHFNRSVFSDFGSGWIPANGNSLILSDPGFNLEGNFEAMRRAQEAMADEKVDSGEYNSFIRAIRFQKDSSLADHLSNDYSYAGRAMGYLAEATRNNPLESGEYFGVRVDPTVMDFRREVLQNSDKRAAFEEELGEKQRAALAKLGRFERSELHDVNLSEFKETALEASNMREINLKNFEVEVEDADTLLLHRKGLFNMFDNPISIRLSGIDAPETAGHEGDPLEQMGARIDQAQPYGQEAKAELERMMEESENLQLLVSSEPQTYGRYTGVVFGETGGADFDDINSWGDFGKSEQVNFNMELIRRGAVASLPFGSQQSDMISRHRAAEAEEEAADHNVGMWQYTRYKASRHMSELLKNSITFNTFTQRQKLADNLDLATYASYLQGMGSTRRDLKRADTDLLKNIGGTLRRHGFSGRKRPDYMKGYRKSGRTFGSFAPPAATDYGYKQTFQRKIPLNRPHPKADDNFHNTIEAFRHEGQAFSGRRRTDFGSGWDGDKSVSKLHPFEDSPNIQNTFTKQTTAQQSPPAKSSSKDNIVRALAVKDISVYNTNNREGVNTTLTELTAQVQGEKIKSGDLALETKRFSWDSDPSRGSKKTSTPTKVDNTKNTNNIKDNNYLSEARQLDSMASRNQRTMKFRNAHHHAIRSIESHRRYPGRRSKRNIGSTILS
jgi:endonuclease YncB( thermonuclease family)